MIKCIVFDLDNTIWEGTLDANDKVVLNNLVKKYIQEAYEKGIVLAIASKNNYEQAYKKIVELGINQYFYKFYISWNDKYKSIISLAKELNISVDDILFIDDSDLELAQAIYYIPSLQILNVKDIKQLEKYLNEVNALTEETKSRNKIYKILEKRKNKEIQMSREDFLKYCDIKVNISIAKREDFLRINELLSRTNQMNLNNKLLTVEELLVIQNNPNYTILSIKMKDIFADYGIVGTTIIKENNNNIEIKNLAISCKVEGRNIGKHVIYYLKELAKAKKKKIIAKYIYNLKNEKLESLLILNAFILNKENVYVYDIDEKKNNYVLNSNECNLKIKKIRNIVNDIGKKKYDINYSFKDEFDSLMFIRLIVTIEKEFNIEIDLSKVNIQNFDTISKIYKFVEENANEN